LRSVRGLAGSKSLIGSCIMPRFAISGQESVRGQPIA
jgi:hypothetical protein